MSDKVRLDCLMVGLGLAQSREKAKALIMAGEVYAGGTKATKPAELFSGGAKIEVRGGMPFVSRGGYKLEKAVNAFGLQPQGWVCADIGASTGGFTDVLLQKGAKLVYAIDVGYGQLDWRLRQDPRVVVLERTNARALAPEWFCQPLDFACMDASFISIKLLLPPLISALKCGASIVALIKPQFEAGRDKVGKKGVVRSQQTHVEVIVSLLSFCRQKGFGIKGLDFSPITGPEGNVEFLLWLGVDGVCAWEEDADGAIARECAQSAGRFHGEKG